MQGLFVLPSPSPSDISPATSLTGLSLLSLLSVLLMSPGVVRAGEPKGAGEPIGIVLTNSTASPQILRLRLVSTCSTASGSGSNSSSSGSALELLEEEEDDEK